MSHVECQECGFIGTPVVEKDVLLCSECSSMKVTECEVIMSDWVTSILPKDKVLKDISKTYKKLWRKICNETK